MSQVNYRNRILGQRYINTFISYFLPVCQYAGYGASYLSVCSCPVCAIMGQIGRALDHGVLVVSDSKKPDTRECIGLIWWQGIGYSVGYHPRIVIGRDSAAHVRIDSGMYTCVPLLVSSHIAILSPHLQVEIPHTALFMRLAVL